MSCRYDNKTHVFNSNKPSTRTVLWYVTNDNRLEHPFIYDDKIKLIPYGELHTQNTRKIKNVNEKNEIRKKKKVFFCSVPVLDDDNAFNEQSSASPLLFCWKHGTMWNRNAEKNSTFSSANVYTCHENTAAENKKIRWKRNRMLRCVHNSRFVSWLVGAVRS